MSSNPPRDERLENLEPLIEKLGGFPVGYPAAATPYAEDMLAVTRRSKVIDEAVWKTVLAWAVHASEYFRLTSLIKPSSRPVKGLSALEQNRATQRNAMMALQRELVATPWARQKSGVGAQTDFLKEMGLDVQDDPASHRGSNVHQFGRRL